MGRVLNQFVTTGDVESHWRSGRPSVVTDDVKEVIEKTIKRRRTATAEEIANVVEEETGRRVSARTMRRVPAAIALQRSPLDRRSDMVQRQVLPPRHKRQFQHDEVRGGTRGRVGSRGSRWVAIGSFRTEYHSIGLWLCQTGSQNIVFA